MIRPPALPGSKDPGLEALRGLASLAVLVWHFCIAFAGPLTADPTYGLAGTPLFAFVHGTGALGFLFLLSGYVLTRRFFLTRQPRLLAETALKRWFRFVPLVLLSVLFSYLLYRFHLYRYAQAAEMTGSGWLASNGGTIGPPVNGTLWETLMQGLFGAFFLKDQTTFNSNLWTIQIEMQGSLAALGFAALIVQIRTKKTLVVLATLFCALLLATINLRLEAFLAGALLAAYMPTERRVKRPLAALCLFLGLFFLGYRQPIGCYAFMRPLNGIETETQYIFSSLIGGALLLFSVTGNATLHRALDRPALRFLGFLSYPLYLFQIPLIGSLGAALFIEFAPDSPWLGAKIAALGLLAVLVPLSAALGAFDVWWSRRLGAATKKLFESQTESKMQHS